MDAFQELTTCRQISMGAEGRIPWTAIHEYAEAHGVRHQRRFERLIRRMDFAWMDVRNKERERDAEKGGDQGKNRG